MNSLRARLFAFVVALALAIGTAVALATYFSVRAEADAIFDYQLRQMALSLRDQGRIADDARGALTHPEFDYVVQVWSADGLALYSSRPLGLAEPLPPRAVLGFSEARLGSDTWRIYGAATPLRVVQVAQPLAVRRRLAATAAGRSVLPIALAAPVVAGGLWWLLGLSLAPLERVVAATRARDAASLEPLPTAGLPRELQPLVGGFNALLARLAEAFAAQRAFVADAAHELRTPLTALKLQLGVLRSAAAPAQQQAALERLRAGIDRAARLVEQLLALARAEPEGPPADGPVDLAAIVRLALADAQPLSEASGASIEAALPAPLAARGDAAALRSLVRNLLDNAVRHAGPGARLHVALAAEGGAPVLCVDDDGPGIPIAERARMFDRFARRTASGDSEGGGGGSGEGSGLGLAIVAAVARRHGLQVALEDSPLGGLRVRVRWPASAARPPAP